MIAITFILVIILNKSGQLNKRIDEYQKQEQTQTERIEELKIKNQTIQEELEAERLRADARVADRLAREAKPAPVTTGVEQWRPLCEKHFPTQTDNCLLVMKHESGGRPTVVSRTNDIGLMQINCATWCKWWSKESLKNPETNMAAAKVIYDRAGSWYPWVAARKLGLA